MDETKLYEYDYDKPELNETFLAHHQIKGGKWGVMHDFGVEYDGVINKPPIEELYHYGVPGMKWGIRKDIRKTGSISDKTKKKIAKTISKASYRKSRRMLNALEDLRANYKGNVEREYKKSKYKGSEKEERQKRNVKEVEEYSRGVQKMVKNKGYEYDKSQKMRFTNRSKAIVGTAAAAGQLLGGTYAGPATSAKAGAIAYGILQAKAGSYKARSGRKNSPWFVSDTDYYKLKKKKK